MTNKFGSWTVSKGYITHTNGYYLPVADVNTDEGFQTWYARLFKKTWFDLETKVALAQAVVHVRIST